MATYGYSSGWCERCGRRRGNDGRCVNCDPWYVSPLVQVGIPVLAATAAALVLLVSTFGPRPSLTPSTSAPRSAASGGVGVLGGSTPAWNAAMPSAPNRGGVISPPFYPSVSASLPVAWTPAPQAASPESRRWEELEQLRSLVWSAAAAERATTDPRATSSMPNSMATADSPG